jgi:hypothetical protein
VEHGVDGKLHSGVEWATCLCSSHGPTRKLTYVSPSVKRNIVNTNVYNNWDLLAEAPQTLYRAFLRPLRLAVFLPTMLLPILSTTC